VSSSPSLAPAVPQWDDSSDYAKAIARTDKLIGQGLSFSGRETNCFFLNKGDGTFATAGAVTGWDFPDDSRAIGLADWDGDGDLDAWLSNRNAPQLRFLRNDTAGKASLMLLLEGKINHEAAGARVTVTLKGQPPLIRTVKLGEGFEAQSTRWLHFGLGKNAVLEKVRVVWPEGIAEEVSGCAPGGRFLVKQGKGTATPARSSMGPPGRRGSLSPGTDTAAVLLTGEQNAPPLPALTYDHKPVLFTDSAGPALIHLWDVTCADCGPELKALTAAREELQKAGLQVVLISAAADDATKAFLAKNNIPFTAVAATEETVRRLRNLHELLFGSDIPLTNPFGLLLDGAGHAAALYRGPCPVERLLSDVRGLRTRWPERAGLTLPFPGQWMDPPGLSNPLTVPGELAERGFLDESLAMFQRHLPACAKQQGCAPVLMALAAAFEGKQRFADAVLTYRLAIRADPAFPGALNNLAWHLAACPDAAQRRPADALPLIREGVSLTNRRDPDLLDTLATVAAANQQWAEAEAALQDAITIARAANRPEAAARFEAGLRRIREQGK
jgi:peroxiredoxin